MTLEIPHQSRWEFRKPLEEVFDYFADVERSIPNHFPGVEKFEPLGPSTYRWVFQSVGYSGYQIAIVFATRFEKDRPKELRAVPVADPKASRLSARWAFTPAGDKTQVLFEAKLELVLPVPSFLKGMAAPLANKEIGRLFDKYHSRVERNFPS